VRAGVVPRHPVEGILLYEQDITLAVAYKLKVLLEADGAAVCVTRKSREEGGGLQIEPYDYTSDGRVRPSVIDTPEIIQPRIDWANRFEAELIVSIHFNGSEDARVRGTEVYYTDAGALQDEGRRLAASLSSGLLSEMRAAGVVTGDRGVKSDRYQRYSADETRRLIANNASVVRANGVDPANCVDCYRLVTLGNNPMSLHRGSYVGAVVEVDFLSNPDVVETFIMRPDSFEIIARGLLNGVRSYFESE
jgi:N-acetylmuramoyl-L-alanine amidase